MMGLTKMHINSKNYDLSSIARFVNVIFLFFRGGYGANRSGSNKPYGNNGGYGGSKGGYGVNGYNGGYNKPNGF